jgi:hypothetical protein
VAFGLLCGSLGFSLAVAGHLTDFLLDSARHLFCAAFDTLLVHRCTSLLIDLYQQQAALRSGSV